VAARVESLFTSIQEQLMADLRSSRIVTKHPGSKGSASEDSWLTVFQRHLPNRYQAHKAFVIDSEGQCSQEIDIVIYDRQYTPLLYNHQGQLFIPAESVYVIFEVKQELNKKWVEYAGKKASSVRVLKRTSGPIPYADGTFKPRKLFPISAGFLSYKSGWTPPFGSAFTKVLKDLKPEQRLDMGCIANSGAFRVAYPQRRDLSIETVGRDRSLLQFFFWFMEHLQSLATAPAIQYPAYAVSHAKAK